MDTAILGACEVVFVGERWSDDDAAAIAGRRCHCPLGKLMLQTRGEFVYSACPARRCLGLFALFANVWGCVFVVEGVGGAFRCEVPQRRNHHWHLWPFGLGFATRLFPLLWTVLHCRGFHNLGDLVMTLLWPYKAWERRQATHGSREAERTAWRFAETLLAFHAFYFQRAAMYLA